MKSNGIESLIINERLHDTEIMTPVDQAFESFGILETILSYSDANDLCHAAAVRTRWKTAARTDSLWEPWVAELWNGKKGVSPKSKLFWRTVYSNDTVERMTKEQLQAVFDHPLLADRKARLTKTEKHDNLEELKRFYKVYMRLDVMFGFSGIPLCFEDIQFGCYASSMMDSKRQRITSNELCSPHGFVSYFKIPRDDVEEADQTLLLAHQEDENILLYHHGTCFFNQDYDFRIVLENDMPSYHPDRKLKARL